MCYGLNGKIKSYGNNLLVWRIKIGFIIWLGAFVLNLLLWSFDPVWQKVIHLFNSESLPSKYFLLRAEEIKLNLRL